MKSPAALHTSENKSFNIDSCLPWEPSIVIVGINVIGGLSELVDSPITLSKSTPR